MSIQSSINQAVQGMMSMIMPMTILKEQGKVGQLKAQQKGLIKENEEWKKQNEEQAKQWNEIINKNSSVNMQESDPLGFFSDNPYSAANDMAGTIATQRVQSEQEKRKAQMERLQKAFQNIGMGGDNNG